MRVKLPSLRRRICMPPHSAANGCLPCGMLCPVSRSGASDRETVIDQLWSAIEALPEPEPPSDMKRPSKQEEVIAMLRRPEGATVDEIAHATGWQRHTVRGLFSGTLKNKLGLNLGSAKEERGRVYRIAEPASA